MSEYDYDLFVIGAGSGGVRAARIAAQHGARVAVAEEYRVGGTCVIRGCVPKKLLVYASHFSETHEDANGFGWSGEASRFDWSTLIANKDIEIDRLNGIYIRNLEASGVEIIQSRAVLADDHSIFLSAVNRTVTAGKILIATGGSPWMPEDLPGVENAISSNDAFHLERLPRKVVVTGGGYIAVEFAGIFNGLGSDTTLIYRGNQILRGFDDDVRVHLAEEMTKKGIRIITNDTIAAVEESSGGLSCQLKNGDQIAADTVMLALGRRPATSGLDLENAGVDMSSDGAIIVDEAFKTSCDNIYAVGDVTNRVNLTPVAIREGHAFADSVFGGVQQMVDHSLIPTAVFSQPEIGTVGFSEADAISEYGDIDIYKSSFPPMKHTLSGRDEKMLMKLIVDATTDTVLGCHVVGDGGAEMAQLLGIALKMGAKKADFDATMALHPTAAEELVTMRSPTAKIRS